LIVLLLGFHGAYQVRSGDAVLRARLAAEAAVQFYRENPDLELKRDLGMLPGAGAAEDIRLSHAEERAEIGYHRMTRRLRARTQAKFDELVDEAMAAYLEASPGWRHGLVPGETELSRIWLHVFYSDSSLALLVGLLFLGLTGFAVEKMLGSFFFSAFCVLSAAVTGFVFLAVHGNLGVPWSGPSGIIAGLVGLYAVVAFSGTTIPGWLVLPLWLFAENFLLRDAGSAGAESIPIYAEGAGLVLGMATGFLLPALQKKVAVQAEDSSENRIRSALGTATQLRGDGKPLDALALLEEELKKAPTNDDLIRSCWQLACEVREPGRVAPAMVILIRDLIRQGQLSQAVGLWLSVEAEALELQVGTQVLVRLGEALLDEGHPRVAVRTLEKSLGSSPSLSAALAVRVVMVARDLDPTLAGRAAMIALRDTHLNPDLAEDLKKLTAAASPAFAGDEPTLSLPEPTAEAPAPMIADSGAPTERRSETPADSMLERGLSFDHDADSSPDTGDMDLDPHALTADRLQESFNQGLPEDLLDGESEHSPSSGGDIASLDPNAFSVSDLQDEVGDLGLEHVEPSAAMPEPSPEQDQEELADTDVDLFPNLRQIEAVAGVPISLGEEGLKFEIGDEGKKRIPYHRIQALSVGAVSGLSSKPVIVIDLVLNWLDVGSSTLKLIRFRSDNFNPVRLMPESQSPLTAISAFFGEILSRSDAIPIPNAQAVRGQPFATYRDLAHYHREALNAEG
jgi:membrane associated rhomboid family serine protease